MSAGRAVPPIPENLDADLRRALVRMRELLHQMLGVGVRSDPDDIVVTPRNATTTLTGAVTNIFNNISTSYVPDLTAPPTPTGLTATAALTHVIVEWDSPAYTAGNGHGRTIVYATKKDPADVSLPTFPGDAGVVASVYGVTTIMAIPSDLNVRWHIWIKWESNDGVKSASPAGGTNGYNLSGAYPTTGKVGSSDLGPAVVLAAALAPGSVTADKASLDIGGDNMAPNNSFELDADSSGIADGWVGYFSTGSPAYSRPAGRISGSAQRITWTGANADRKGFYTGSELGGGIRGGWQANKTYVISFYARAGAAHSAGNGCELAWDTAPSTTTTLKNPDVSTTWQRYAFRVTHGGSPQINGLLHITCKVNGGQTGYMEYDDVQVEEGDYLSGYMGKLALNTIVAGDGAIANLAITNGLIGNLAVDNAKIASLAVDNAKIADATIAHGKIASIDATKITVNQLLSTQIDTRNLTIKDGSGNVIFGSGASVNPSSFMQVQSGWLNSNISISSGGVLSGAGGGSVTIGGLGYTGDLAATKNIVTWSAGAPGSPANGDVWVDTSTTPYVTKVRVSGAWQIAANHTTNSTELTDGAGWSTTATWANVSGTGKPADNSTRNNLTVSGSAPGSPANGDLWFDTTNYAWKVYSGGWQIASDITAQKTAAAIAGQGAFATLSQITNANISTYIASAAIELAQIKVASIGSLSALSANLGTVTAGTMAAGTIFAGALSAVTGNIGAIEVATTGHVRGGSTDYDTGNGFFIGYSGGAYKASFKNGSNYWRFNGAKVEVSMDSNDLALEAFTAAIGSGDLIVSGVPHGTQAYGSRGVSVTSGGKAPYTYSWVLSPLGTSGSSVFISDGASSSTCYFSGSGDGQTNVCRATCLVGDANGRLTMASVTIAATHTGSGQ